MLGGGELIASFLDAYVLVLRTGQGRNLLTPGEAKKILASLTAESPTEQLLRLVAVEEPCETDQAALQALDEVSQAIGAPVRPSRGTILTDAASCKFARQCITVISARRSF
jgi:hypothetical protein